MEELQNQKDFLDGRHCPMCEGDKHPGIIVCLSCWGKLHEKNAQSLLLADVYAVGRRLWFYDRLERGYDPKLAMTWPPKNDLPREPINPKRGGPRLPGQADLGL